MDNLLPEFQSHKRKIPEFIIKLYHILENQDFNEIISWTSQGNQILIKNPKRLQDKVLPHFFRHKHLSSFVRQLNMYGFNKANKVMKEKNHTYFRNEFFKRNDIYLLTKINRKNNKNKTDHMLEQKRQSYSDNSDVSHQETEFIQQKQSYKNIVKNSIEIIENQINAVLLLIQSQTNQNKKIQRPRRKQQQQQNKSKSESLQQHIKIKQKLMSCVFQCEQIKQAKQILDTSMLIKKNEKNTQPKIQEQEQNSFVIQYEKNGPLALQDPPPSYICQQSQRELFSIKSLKDFFPKFDSINCFTSQYNIMDKIEPNNNNSFQYE